MHSIEKNIRSLIVVTHKDIFLGWNKSIHLIFNSTHRIYKQLEHVWSKYNYMTQVGSIIWSQVLRVRIFEKRLTSVLTKPDALDTETNTCSGKFVNWSSVQRRSKISEIISHYCLKNSESNFGKLYIKLRAATPQKHFALGSYELQ